MRSPLTLLLLRAAPPHRLQQSKMLACCWLLLIQKQSLWLLLADPKLNCGRRYDNHDVRPRPDIAALITEEEEALAADPEAAGPEHVSWYERPR